jgi:hypothetical protein
MPSGIHLLAAALNPGEDSHLWLLEFIVSGQRGVLRKISGVNLRDLNRGGAYVD